MLRLHGNELHVSGFHVHIFGRNVFAAQAVHKLAKPAHECFRLQFGRVTHDYRFATAQIETTDGRFERHATREAQYIGQRFLLGGVVPHAGSAQGRAQRGIVDGNHGPQTGMLIVTKYYLLVTHLHHFSQNSRLHTFQFFDLHLVIVLRLYSLLLQPASAPGFDGHKITKKAIFSLLNRLH